MKKIIVVVLLALAPAFTFADTGGGIAGAVVGVGLGSLIGHGNGTVAAQVVLGLAGASMGSRIEDGTYGKGGVEVVYVAPPQYSYPSQYEPALCHDARSGGRISCQFLADNPRYERWGVIESNVSPPPPLVAMYRQQPVQTAVYSQNMWERPEKQHRAEYKRQSRLTVGNYTERRAVHEECQTGNWGVDSNCLNRMADKLAALQTRCEKGEVNNDCRGNPGVLAGEYYDLASSLRHLQKERQGRDFATR